MRLGKISPSSYWEKELKQLPDKTTVGSLICLFVSFSGNFSGPNLQICGCLDLFFDFPGKSLVELWNVAYADQFWSKSACWRTEKMSLQALIVPDYQEIWEAY